MNVGRGLTACLDLARVHGEHQARAPVFETLVDTALYCFDYFTGESAEFVSG